MNLPIQLQAGLYLYLICSSLWNRQTKRRVWKMENPRFHASYLGRRRRLTRSPAGDAPVPSQDKKKEVYHRRSADAAGADRAFFLSCESRFFDLNLRKKGDENGNEPSSPSAAMQTHSLAACKMRWRAALSCRVRKNSIFMKCF